MGASVEGSKMSNTPRTDAATVRMERLDGDIDEVVSVYFACNLERENAELLEKLRAATSMPCAPSATAAPPVEVGAIAWQDKALAHLAVVRVLMPPQDVLLVQDFINDSRMKGEPVDHGYDRTASLSAGRYVCTCGGACSHYTTEREQPK